MKKKTVQVIYEMERKTNIYRKIPKISPSMHKTPQNRQRKKPFVKYKPPPRGGGGLYLKIALKYKVKQEPRLKLGTVV